MSVQILHGDIAYSESPQALSIHENAYMAVEDGAVRNSRRMQSRAVNWRFFMANTPHKFSLHL